MFQDEFQNLLHDIVKSGDNYQKVAVGSFRVQVTENRAYVVLERTFDVLRDLRLNKSSHDFEKVVGTLKINGKPVAGSCEVQRSGEVFGFGEIRTVNLYFEYSLDLVIESPHTLTELEIGYTASLLPSNRRASLIGETPARKMKK